MLIVSKFRDYYDTALTHGVDKSIVYRREEKEIVLGEKHEQLGLDAVLENIDKYPQHRHPRWEHEKRKETIDFDAIPFLIGFCGKVYPAFKVSWYIRSAPMANPTLVHDYAYSLNEMKEQLFNIKEDYLEWFCREEKQSKWFRQWRSNDRKFNDRSVKSYFEYNHTADYGHLFQEHKAPIFAVTFERAWGWGKDTLVLNPCLKDIGFVRVVDPYTALQELMMYIPGVLGVGEPVTVDVSDKTVAAKHGFDKWSFRNPSPGRKARKQG